MAHLVDYLRRHPFPVVAWFERVVAASFAFPEEILRPLVPKRLEIDTYCGFGFVTVAMVWTKDLRPAGFPAFFGQDFLLAGYRIFTRLDDGQRRLRGLQILRSETDRRRMVWLGNLMTHYRYRYVKAEIQEAYGQTRVQMSRADGAPTLDLTFAAADDRAPLPEGSPFGDWKTARRFAGPMPFTFSEEDEDTFVVIEGSRQDWLPHPVSVKKWRIAIFDEAPLREATPILANAFAVNGVAYRWKKGRIVRLGAGA
ncbi:MAG: hypothetical protein DME97_09905 [Verrucomicrobia bacterium]|nr:MAG: hypothetical protein DME97_09905 [Verrucomicrobiota bacterium]